MFLRQHIMRFTACSRGLMTTEFAILLPLLIVLLLGMIEIGHYTLLNQKLDKAASSMADFVTQSESTSRCTLQTYASTIPQIISPYRFDTETVDDTQLANATVIFNHITQPGSGREGLCDEVDTTCITWQEQIGAAGSRVGVADTHEINFPDYYVFPGQNIILVEVFYDYVPFFPFSGDIISSFSPHQLYKTVMYKPRMSTLDTLNPC